MTRVKSSVIALSFLSSLVSCITQPSTNRITLDQSLKNSGIDDVMSPKQKKRKKKKRTVPIIPPIEKEQHPKTKKSGTKKSRITITSSSDQTRDECLRRLKREWKDAVSMGVAYDWSKMKTIKSSRADSSSNNNNSTNPTDGEYVRLGPFQGNLLRWHFSITGPANSVYEGGLYHGRVLLPRNYPGSPPRVQLLTPSGRFQPGADICLTASNFHPETWTPRWTILSLVNALRLHMLTPANEIGGVQASVSQRQILAKQSRYWKLRTRTTKWGRREAEKEEEEVAALSLDHELMIPLFFKDWQCDLEREGVDRMCTTVTERVGKAGLQGRQKVLRPFGKGVLEEVLW
eukprot:CAMPEP_0172504856 /NCGR_PEP_ID=MMETSP1066-20121228/181846_1 /TAXON_ID=671091 /ORGANISM="Coscinodiscus wailesii, Strain CCMP2513" /LENGTH=345 /DNA_ID=CAMNT_0013281231 /DNA_START=67 /DNA_END=1101 /DNA_ORIENTATION=+